jgi:ATP-dependent helicase/nuclease subunit B
MRFDHSVLPGWLEAGAVVVTPTPLLASAIHRQYAEHQIARGQRSWSQPSVSSLNAWLQHTWREARACRGEDLPILLSSGQEQLLWEQAISRSGAGVLDVSATARSAMGAARFVAEWRLPLRDSSWDSVEDTAQFRAWSTEVSERCLLTEWAPSTGLLRHVLERLNQVPMPKHLVFAGFDQFSRGLDSLVHRLEAMGVKVERTNLTRETAALLAVPCSDFREELDSAARWARARLEENPRVSIALFVQNLREHHSFVAKILRDVLQPAAVLQPLSRDTTPNPAPFHIHCGAPLLNHPVIAVAFSILDFARPLIPLSSVSAVLGSPFLPGAGLERTPRAFADAALRRIRELELPLGAVENVTSKCAHLHKHWTPIRAALKRRPSTDAEPAEWSRFWRELLKAAGWPGDAPLSQFETDAVDEWRDLLSSFESLGLTGGRFSSTQAVARLRSLAAAEGPSDGDLSSPIQVLAPGDAAGLAFDHAWLVGASELEWPPASFAPAYVPLELLRSEGVPIATAAGRRADASRLTRYVQSCAPSVIASYGSSDATGAKLSALFQNVEEVTPDRLFLWNGKTVLGQLRSHKLEEIEDTDGPPLQPGAIVAGGTGLLKSQSACPFQAFARWRLTADSLEEGAFSYDPRQRGEFLHQALAAVWREIKTSQRLRTATPSELQALVSTAVGSALSSDRLETVFRVQLRNAERQRLVSLILNWLDIEKQRPGNFEISDLEAASEFQLSRLMLRLRADRIDKLDNGGLVVIDYKSGKVNRDNLDTERPREPQLLVYAETLRGQVDGVYFASLRREAQQAAGYGRKQYFNEKTQTPDWNAQLRSWQTTIRNLAEGFEKGRAARTPLPKACDYCEIKPICRIEEDRRRRLAEEAD